MRNMSKVAAMGLATLLVVAACGNSSTSTSGPKSLINDIKERGELRIGVASAQPWVWKDPTTGVWQGVYIDVMAQWAKELNVKLTPVATSWDNIVAGVQAGQFDVAVALNQRPARALAVTFTDQLMSQISAFSFYPDKTPVTTWEQLNDPKYTICVMQGSAQDLSLTNYEPKVQVLRLVDQDSCRLAVEAGKANAAMDDWAGLGPDAAAHPGMKIIFPSTPMTAEGIAYAIPHGYSYDDIAAINIQIKDFIKTGALAVSVKKWGAVNPVAFAIEPIPPYVLALEAVQYPGE